MVARRLRDATSAGWPLAAAGCFILAVAAKPTAAYCGVAAVLALLCAERRADAWRLALVWIGGCGAMVLAIAVCSHGRAIDAFRACALAGGGPLALLRPMSLAEAAARLRASHLLVATLGLFVTALLFSRRHWCELPVLLCAGAGTAAILALGTAGTVPINQSVEPYAVTAVCLVWMCDQLVAPPAIGSVVLTALLLWAGMQSAREIHVFLASDVPPRWWRSGPRWMPCSDARAAAESPPPILTGRPATFSIRCVPRQL